jgi:hypothetical protein
MIRLFFERYIKDPKTKRVKKSFVKHLDINDDRMEELLKLDGVEIHSWKCFDVKNIVKE